MLVNYAKRICQMAEALGQAIDEIANDMGEDTPYIPKLGLEPVKHWHRGRV